MIFFLNIQVQTIDLGRQRGFLLDGEDPPERVGCRKESYFLEFMNVDVTRDFVGVVSLLLLLLSSSSSSSSSSLLLLVQL